MDQLTPDQIAGRSFRQTFRGVDPAEVREFLAAVAGQMDELIAQRDRLAGRLGEFAERDLKGEFAAVGQEVTAVLEAARAGAEGMRDRAATDAARWRSEAMVEAESERRSAREDAEHLRSDAWSTSEELLRQAQAESRRLKETAERDSLSVLGEAEREAHRLTAAARRESEDLTRGARMESERLNAEAIARHDQTIETARRQAETSQERARALEQRRQELLTELETLRASLSRMEGELDERRTGLGLSTAGDEVEEETPALRVARPAEMKREDWEPGETVRVVRRRRSTQAQPVTDSEEVVEDVRRISQASLVETPSFVEESEPAEAADEVPSASASYLVAPAAESREPADDPPEPNTDELGLIFSRLRGRQPAKTQPTAPEAPAPPPPKPEPLTDTDPLELFRRLTMPVTNRALRSVKRQLTEMQNTALEAIRVSEGGWRPTNNELEDQLRPDLVVLLAESFSMGHTAAEQLVGKSFPRPATPPRDEAGPIAAALAQQLELLLAVEHGGSPRDISTAVARVFRGWRTDEAERRLTDLSSQAYHDGLAASLAPGHYRLGWVLSGRGCARCREEADDGGQLTPPLHPGCSCTLVPMSG
ncbi:MAG: DivIVA domain-containing protein [Actinomycetota bacterium]